MRIHFKDGTAVDITLSDSVLKSLLLRSFKHLQHIDIPFRPWDWPNFVQHTDLSSQVDQLVTYANELLLDIDRQRCQDSDQEYYNFLHSIYEKNYDGRKVWIDFHESIHTLEALSSDKSKDWLNVLNINYREQGGLLETKFDREWIPYLSTEIKKGQVYCHWSELGKDPWQYWQDREPDDIERICELCKPWNHWKPVLRVAMADRNLLENPAKDLANFQSWWSSYEKDWCRYWNLDNWTWQEQFAVLPVGYIHDLDAITEAARNDTKPYRISLCDNLNKEESLLFVLVIEATWSSHPPRVEILVDDRPIEIPHLDKGTNHIEFKLDMANGSHTLELRRTGATSQDASQMVGIVQLSIDNIDCSQLILCKSTFRPSYPEPWATQQRSQNQVLLDLVPFETQLGHDGVWQMPFSSPFYPYALEINSQQLHSAHDRV